MRKPIILLGGLLAGLSVFAAVAQTAPDNASGVTINTDALRKLTPPAPAKSTAKPASAVTAPAQPAAAGIPAITPPKLAVAPPEIAQLPPPVAVPVRPMAKPVVDKPVDKALGEASLIAGGIRLAFDTDGSDLNPAMDRALRAFARAALPGPVSLDAYATSRDQDPSTPRRLSLARAMAARSILIDAGFASDKIYVRAHARDSAAPAGTPADRIDITTLTQTHS